MEQLYFSVVMPVYNKEAFVKKSIYSVLKQTYPHFELIVVDDGSTDNSGQIITAIDDKRIHYIKQENGGESVARNHGIALAQYSYVAFLDSDDVWLPDYLETMCELIKKYPQAGAYGCSYLHEQVVEGTLEKAILMPKKNTDVLIENYFDYDMTHEQSLTASTTTVRKSVFENVGGFPVGLTNWVDLDLWARIGLYYDVAFTDKICAIYNDVPGSVSKIPAKLHAPTYDNYKTFLRKQDITVARKKTFREYVIQKKLYSTYQQYLADGKRAIAFWEILPLFGTKRNRKMYWSMLLQFVITPKHFLKINQLRKKVLK